MLKKNKLYFIYILLYGIISCTNVVAQKIDYLFKHLTIANGLLSNPVGAIQQDKKGFFWIGTQTGLQRYEVKNL